VIGKHEDHIGIESEHVGNTIIRYAQGSQTTLAPMQRNAAEVYLSRTGLMYRGVYDDDK
jgi:hypothetical protein